MMVALRRYLSSISRKKMFVCSGRRLRYPSSSITSRSTRARRSINLREERSASEAYISSKRFWARKKTPR